MLFNQLTILYFGVIFFVSYLPGVCWFIIFIEFKAFSIKQVLEIWVKRWVCLHMRGSEQLC
jgi:hypothetical protein